MYGEYTLYANTIAQTANYEVLTYATALTGNNHTFEQLNTFLLAFLNLTIYLYGIAGTEVRNVFAQLFLFQHIKNNVHFVLLKIFLAVFIDVHV